MLSKLMLSGANCITMDDPTNHLDLEAIQSLNEGLIAFPGVLLFSSHDHEFIQSIANRIVEITPNGIIDRMMSFDDYITDPQVTELRKKLYEGTGKKIKYRVQKEIPKQVRDDMFEQVRDASIGVCHAELVSASLRALSLTDLKNPPAYHEFLQQLILLAHDIQ